MYKTQARNQYAITYSASLTTTLAAPYRLGELLKRANVLNQSNSDETGSDQGQGIAHEAHTCPKSSTSTRTRNQNENAVFFLLKKSFVVVIALVSSIFNRKPFKQGRSEKGSFT